MKTLPEHVSSLRPYSAAFGKVFYRDFPAGEKERIVRLFTAFQLRKGCVGSRRATLASIAYKAVYNRFALFSPSNNFHADARTMFRSVWSQLRKANDL